MKANELNLGDKVDIIYMTYTNNGGMRRWLRNLQVMDFYKFSEPRFNSIVFKQLTNGKNFTITIEDIKAIYRNK